MNKPSRTGDLAAAVESTDRAALGAVAVFVLLLGVVAGAGVVVRDLRRASKAERAEWAFWCQQLETERDIARERAPRFTAEPPGGDVVDEAGDD